MRRFRNRRPLGIETLENRYALSYVAIDLGAFTPSAVNSAGLIAGSANGRAAIWNNGTVIDLGPGQANDINNSGQVVGTSGNHAFLLTPEDVDANGQPDRWFRDSDANGRNDLMVDLGTLGGTESAALALNSNGEVAGRSRTASSGAAWHAFRWDSTTGMQDLGTFGRLWSEATAINDSGQIVGDVHGLFGGVNAFRWTPTTGGALLPPLPGDSLNTAKGINNAGHVVGNSGNSSGTTYQPRDAVLWQGGSTTALGFGPYSNYDVAINNVDQVAGNGWVWENGVHTKLNDLIDPALGWSITDTFDMNDSGMIVGRGTNDGQAAPFLLVPSTTPIAPAIAIGNVSVTEGDLGTANVVFTLSLSEASAETVTVNFATADGTGRAGSDFIATAGTVTFAPGVTSQTLSVSVIGDTRDENNETFVVKLSNPINALVTDGQAVGTIVDNDLPPALSITDVKLSEGNSGIIYFVFTVSLSAASDKAITVNYATADGTATSSGKNADYQAASGMLIFAPGETTKTITIAILPDKRKEANETFFLNLFGAVDAAILDAQGLGTIVNDDK